MREPLLIAGWLCVLLVIGLRAGHAFKRPDDAETTDEFVPYELRTVREYTVRGYTRYAVIVYASSWANAQRVALRKAHSYNARRSNAERRSGVSAR